MPALLVSYGFRARYGAEIVAAAARRGMALELLVLPPDPAARLAEPECARIDIAFFTQDVYPEFSRPFFSATRKAPGLKWLHVFNAGVDHPVYASILERGVRLTTSSGATAEPIAHTAIAGLLMLARNFPVWLAAQRGRVWAPLRPPALPRDLRSQTALILGLGEIGTGIARLAKALGLRVIGVRRRPLEAGEPADEWYPPEKLAELLPRCDWLVVACPLNPGTRGLINAEMIARLPRGARLINVARGEIVEERALTEALASGHLGGAYLDVFETEPLPPDSPLWDMPNVIVTPHNSAASAGNEERVNGIFLDNLERYARGEPLVNEVVKL